jgi:hypothetical protein
MFVHATFGQCRFTILLWCLKNKHVDRIHLFLERINTNPSTAHAYEHSFHIMRRLPIVNARKLSCDGNIIFSFFFVLFLELSEMMEL